MFPDVCMKYIRQTNWSITSTPPVPACVTWQDLQQRNKLTDVALGEPFVLLDRYHIPDAGQPVGGQREGEHQQCQYHGRMLRVSINFLQQTSEPQETRQFHKMDVRILRGTQKKKVHKKGTYSQMTHFKVVKMQAYSDEVPRLFRVTNCPLVWFVFCRRIFPPAHLHVSFFFFFFFCPPLVAYFSGHLNVRIWQSAYFSGHFNFCYIHLTCQGYALKNHRKLSTSQSPHGCAEKRDELRRKDVIKK